MLGVVVNLLVDSLVEVGVASGVVVAGACSLGIGSGVMAKLSTD